jgi:uncharacterized LabA/DUF88 family protein
MTDHQTNNSGRRVGIFVDVANVFYASLDAGREIDYPTLLAHAIEGRELVRAYAYTGLDPENEAQKKFHRFLGESGYRVVAKEVRRFKDGAMKANLDIELVVDLMRLAPRLDVAVIVAGDGDYAPAIRAIMDMGVRVEVICFRHNTSKDLLEVADSFEELTEVATVAGRSNRNSSAPKKETAATNPSRRPGSRRRPVGAPPPGQLARRSGRPPAAPAPGQPARRSGRAEDAPRRPRLDKAA